MNVADLDHLYETFVRSVWRLETRQHYVVPDDGPRLEAWRTGEPLPPRPGKTRWLAEVREMVATGKQVGRVHVVDLPLSDYVRYELDVYRENVAAGEQVLVVDRGIDPRLATLTQDFALFDSETAAPTVVLFDYAPDGQLLGYRLSVEPAVRWVCRLGFAVARGLAVPLDDFVAAIA